MAHEETISFEAEGRHFLAPTKVGGKKLTGAQVADLIMSGRLRPLAQASTRQDIERMAVERTRSFDGHSHGVKKSMPTPEIYRLQDLLAELSGGVQPAVYRPDPNDPRDPIPQADRKKFQVQPAGFRDSRFDRDDTRQHIERLKQHIRAGGTPPFVDSPEYQQARREVSGENPLVNLLQQLAATSQPRPDILSESQGGPSFGSPSYRAPGDQTAATFLGRLVKPGENVQQVLSRVPTGELESGGQALNALPQALIQAGVINAAIKRASGINPAGGLLPASDFPVSPLWGVSPHEILRSRVLKEPKFDKFQARIQAKIAKELGEEFPVYRGVVPSELEEMVAGRLRPHTPFSLDPNVAYGFATPGGAVLQGTATPKSVVFPGARKGAFAHEKELVLNPSALKDLQIYERLKPSTRIQAVPGQTFSPLSDEDINAALIRVLGQMK